MGFFKDCFDWAMHRTSEKEKSKSSHANDTDEKSFEYIPDPEIYKPEKPLSYLYDNEITQD